MTKTASKTKRRRSTSGTASRSAAKKTTRPLHKRILLSPFMVFLLLCAGVLIVGSTLRGSAATYDVTATVPAPAVTTPATILTPADQAVFSAPDITVAGDCAPQSYVKVTLDSVSEGIALCTNGHYALATALAPGPNQLAVQIYNLTDQQGPTTQPITVFYNPPITVSTVPTTIGVASIEGSGFAQGGAPDVSDTPTIRGTAPPLSHITLTFHSAPVTCETQADSSGVWSCTLKQALPEGLHHVDILAVTPSGQQLTYPTFAITVVKAFVNTTLIWMKSNYQYRLYHPGQLISWGVEMGGGRLPYKLTVDWGDHHINHLTITSRNMFYLNHAYQSEADYIITLNAADSANGAGVMQLVAVVQAPGDAPAAIVGGTSGPFATLFSGVQQRLWLIWPSYIVVVLMVIGYWLGEREEYQQLMARRRPVRRAAGRVK